MLKIIPTLNINIKKNDEARLFVCSCFSAEMLVSGSIRPDNIIADWTTADSLIHCAIPFHNIIISLGLGGKDRKDWCLDVEWGLMDRLT